MVDRKTVLDSATAGKIEVAWMTCRRLVASMSLRILAGTLTVSATVLVCLSPTSATEPIFSTEAERIATQLPFTQQSVPASVHRY